MSELRKMVDGVLIDALPPSLKVAIDDLLKAGESTTAIKRAIKTAPHHGRNGVLVKQAAFAYIDSKVNTKEVR